MTDRDHFAAAALAGLLSLNKPGHGQQMPDEIIRRAFRWADAMLRERERTNHDAAPAAIAEDLGAGDSPATEPALSLTDAEREALSWFTGGRGPVCPQYMATIRGLLERTK